MKVGVCAGCNAMYPWAACAIGCLAGVVFHFSSFLVRRVGVDDPVDAVAGKRNSLTPLFYFDIRNVQSIRSLERKVLKKAITENAENVG